MELCGYKPNADVFQDWLASLDGGHEYARGYYFVVLQKHESRLAQTAS
jgi:hypothetical protein